MGHALGPAILIPDETGDAFIEFPLRLAGRENDVLHPARRQGDGAGAAVSDHDLREEPLEFTGVLWLVFIRDKMAFERAVGPQLPRPEKGDQVEEFFQVVLERRGRDEQKEPLWQAVDELPVLGGGVLEAIMFKFNIDIEEN